jgi:hypothetical protein
MFNTIERFRNVVQTLPNDEATAFATTLCTAIMSNIDFECRVMVPDENKPVLIVHVTEGERFCSPEPSLNGTVVTFGHDKYTNPTIIVNVDSNHTHGIVGSMWLDTNNQYLQSEWFVPFLMLMLGIGFVPTGAKEHAFDKQWSQWRID